MTPLELLKNNKSDDIITMRCPKFMKKGIKNIANNCQLTLPQLMITRAYDYHPPSKLDVQTRAEVRLLRSELAKGQGLLKQAITLGNTNLKSALNKNQMTLKQIQHLIDLMQERIGAQ